MLEEYYLLVLIVLLAFISPLIFTRIGIPVVVGEILLGLAVGAAFYVGEVVNGEELFEVGESVEFLATTGFIFLMFLSGLEIDFGKIEKGGTNSLIRGSMMYVLTLVLGLPLVLVVSELISIEMDAVFMALVLSTTSVAIVLSVAREMRISRKQYGQNIIITSLIADMGAMILITIYAIGYEVESTNDPLFALTAFIIFMLIFLFFIFIWYVGSLAIWHHPKLLRKFFASDDPHEIGVRTSLAIIFIFVAISAVIDSEALAVLGAFLAGAVISLLFREGAILEKKLYGIGYGFLVPIFFINIGIGFDFDAIFNQEALVLIPTLFVITFLAKIIPAVLISKRTNLRKNFVSGILMTGGLTLMIAGAEIGLGLGIIDPTAHGVLILLAIVFAVISPIGFRDLYKKFGMEGEK